MALMTPETACWDGGNAHRLDVAASNKPAATMRGMSWYFIRGLNVSLAQLHQLAGATLGATCGRSSRDLGVLLPIARAGLHGCVLLDERRDGEHRRFARCFRPSQLRELLHHARAGGECAVLLRRGKRGILGRLFAAGVRAGCGSASQPRKSLLRTRTGRNGAIAQGIGGAEYLPGTRRDAQG